MAFFTLVVLVLFLGAMLVWICSGTARQSLERAVVGTVINVVVIPMYAPPNSVTAISLIGGIVLLIVALIRGGGLFLRSRPRITLWLFIAWSLIAGRLQGDQGWNIVAVAEAILYLLLAFVVGSLDSDANPLVKVLPLMVVVEFILASSEQFLGTHALWPRVDGVTDEISRRGNTLAPFLIGRSMGSVAYPITLGILAGLGIVAVIWRFKRDRSFRWLCVALLGVVLIVFSGTRTAAAGVAIVLGASFVFSSKGTVWFRAIVLLASSAALALIIDPLAIFGLTGISESSSYEHRLRLIESIPALFSRDFWSVLVGTGYSSIPEVLRSGLLGLDDGIYVLDQQLIRTFIATGLVGLFLLVTVICKGWISASKFDRIALLLMVITFFTYDTLSWRSLMVIFIVLVGRMQVGIPSIPKNWSGGIKAQPQFQTPVRKKQIEN